LSRFVVALDVTPDQEAAESADPAVETNAGAAPSPLGCREFAPDPVAPDLVAAVLRIEELVLEPKRLWPRPLSRCFLGDHAEVAIERCGGGSHEKDSAERSENADDDELAHGCLLVALDGPGDPIELRLRRSMAGDKRPPS
jgi:hypothetical protein